MVDTERLHYILRAAALQPPRSPRRWSLALRKHPSTRANVKHAILSDRGHR